MASGRSLWPSQMSCLSQLVARSPLPQVLLVLVACFLSLWGVVALRAWGDSGYSVYLATKGLSLSTSFTAGDSHPPLYYYLLHFWTSVAGYSELSLRWLSAMPFLLTVTLVYKLGERILGRKVALLGCASWLVSPPFSSTSHDFPACIAGCIAG